MGPGVPTTGSSAAVSTMKSEKVLGAYMVERVTVASCGSDSAGNGYGRRDFSVRRTKRVRAHRTTFNPRSRDIDDRALRSEFAET